MMNFTISLSTSEYKNLLIKQYSIKQKFDASKNFDLLKYMFNYLHLQQYEENPEENPEENLKNDLEEDLEENCETSIQILERKYLRKLYFRGLQMINITNFQNANIVLEKLKNEFSTMIPFELEREMFEDDISSDEDETPENKLSHKKFKKDKITNKNMKDELLYNLVEIDPKNTNIENMQIALNRIEQYMLRCCYVKKIFELSECSKIEYFKHIAIDEEIKLKNINFKIIPENIIIYRFNETNNKITRTHIEFKFFSSYSACEIYYKLSYPDQTEYELIEKFHNVKLFEKKIYCNVYPVEDEEFHFDNPIVKPIRDENNKLVLLNGQIQIFGNIRLPYVNGYETYVGTRYLKFTVGKYVYEKNKIKFIKKYTSKQMLR